MPYAVTSDKVRLYYEETGSGTPIFFLYEFAADHAELVTADALFFARTSLYRLFRARLHAVRCAAIIGDLHLSAFLCRRARRARSSGHRHGALRRPVDDLLFVVAGRLACARTARSR